MAQAAGRHAAGVAARAPLHHAARLHALRPLGPRDRHLIGRLSLAPRRWPHAAKRPQPNGAPLGAERGPMAARQGSCAPQAPGAC